QGFGVQTPDDAVEDAGRELAVRMLQRKRSEILVLRAHDSAAPGHPDHLAEHRRRLVHVEEDRHGERDVEPTGPEREPAAVGNPEGDAPVEAVDVGEAARGGHARPARVDPDDLTTRSDHPGKVAGDGARPAPDLKHAGSPAHAREPEEAAAKPRVARRLAAPLE